MRVGRSDSASYVDVLNNPLLDLTNQITLAVWVYAVNGGPDILNAKGTTDAEEEIGNYRWRFATGLTASESGVLQPLSEGTGYELVMDHNTGEGLRGSPTRQGTLICVQ